MVWNFDSKRDKAKKVYPKKVKYQKSIIIYFNFSNLQGSNDLVIITRTDIKIP